MLICEFCGVGNNNNYPFKCRVCSRINNAPVKVESTTKSIKNLSTITEILGTNKIKKEEK